MKKKSVLAAFTFSALALFAFGAGFAQDVRYNFDKKTDFAKFKTYKWVEVKDAPKFNDLVHQQVKQAIEAQLAEKGLTKTEEDTADLFVAYQGAIKQEKEFSSYDSSWGYGPGWYGGGWYRAPSSSWSTGETSTIYVGQIAVDMYDSANKSLVWRGIASKTIDQKAKPEKQEKNLKKAMEKLLKNYPPNVKS